MSVTLRKQDMCALYIHTCRQNIHMHTVRIHESSEKELTNHVKIKMVMVFILEEN